MSLTAFHCWYCFTVAVIAIAAAAVAAAVVTIVATTFGRSHTQPAQLIVAI